MERSPIALFMTTTIESKVKERQMVVLERVKNVNEKLLRT